MTAEVDVVPTIDVDFKPIFWDNPATEPISDPPSPRSGLPLKSAYLALVLNQPSMESEDPPIKSEYSSLESDFSSGPNSSAEMIHKVETRPLDVLLQPPTPSTPDMRASTQFLMKNELEDLFEEYSKSYQKLRKEIEKLERWVDEHKGGDPFYEPRIRAAKILSAKLQEDMDAVHENVKLVQLRLSHHDCKLDCDIKWDYNAG
ncbi:MAG: hypothetical protein Q9203_002783 [Teloschistes exilis]